MIYMKHLYDVQKQKQTIFLMKIYIYITYIYTHNIYIHICVEKD